MAKRMLADVLWEAANVCLAAHSNWAVGVEHYSCNAALLAELGRAEFNKHLILAGQRNRPGQQFLKSLGCDPASDHPAVFLKEEFVDAEERQGVRYMWLLLAMHVAEDEGIEIEVSA